MEWSSGSQPGGPGVLQVVHNGSPKTKPLELYQKHGGQCSAWSCVREGRTEVPRNAILGSALKLLSTDVKHFFSQANDTMLHNYTDYLIYPQCTVGEGLQPWKWHSLFLFYHVIESLGPSQPVRLTHLICNLLCIKWHQNSIFKHSLTH